MPKARHIMQYLDATQPKNTNISTLNAAPTSNAQNETRQTTKVPSIINEQDEENENKYR